MLCFSTKADTLKALATVIQSAKVLPQVSFHVREFQQDNRLPIHLLKEANFCNVPVIVRSSAQNEDTETSSNAGKYLSLADIQGDENILAAVSQVVSAMGENEENQVFIQPYLSRVSMCGVAFTMDPNTGGNYYIINYDDTSGQTSSVTGGFGASLRTYCRYKYAEAPAHVDAMSPIVAACAELEQLFGHHALDIEFACSDGVLYILQVRPLVLTVSPSDPCVQTDAIRKIQEKLHMAIQRQPNILGEKTIYGVMPDWNPAEMIGIRPRPLALSLYKEIITDGVWAYQRNNYGYRNLRSFPLMLDFCGLPYIDTRVSFNSFLPKDLSDHLAEKLVDYYINQLRQAPAKHDKIEFDIAFTCYTFDVRERLATLADFGFAQAEIDEFADALLRLTNNVIDKNHGLWKIDRDRIDTLCDQHKLIVESDMDTLSKVYWLLENCKRYGTLPFAGLARAGFIAAEFLKSLVSTGIITEQEKFSYLNSISTIGKELTDDFRTLTKPAFLKKYGHLRPGTYDICSMRYDKSGDRYFNFDMQPDLTEVDAEPFRLSLDQYAEIQSRLDANGIHASVLDWFEFIKAATEGREYSKFVFTRTLSDVLELLAQLGEELGFSREDMSYVSIADIMRAYSTSCDMKELLMQSIKQGRANHGITMGLILPPLIFHEADVVSFMLPDGEPNFITQKTCEAEVVLLKNEEIDMNGKIVLIKSADPGYDWIFSRNIAGFITAYGGANSHMAIRAAEFSTPAIIGVGEKRFEQYRHAKRLHFDCANRKVFALV